jgi:hypothetical protein
VDFDRWAQLAWADHATDAEGVAARIAAVGLALPTTDAELGRLAHLSHHVYGEHLGLWAAGSELLQRLAAHPACAAGGAAVQSLRLYQASLALCAGTAEAGDAGATLGATLGTSERVRVAALAAANLAERDTARAQALFRQALAEAEASALPSTDPHVRALAVSGNNLAAALGEKHGRSAAERELMILAAQTARRYWALAGGWLETERAEHRLAMTWLHAGDLAQARHHAQQCLEIIQAHEGPALERFFGCDALGQVERAAGNAAGHAQALAQAREAYAALEEADRGWCLSSLDDLARETAHTLHGS